MWEKLVVTCFMVLSAGGLRKTTKISVRVEGIPAEVRTELATKKDRSVTN
jgi:hypothetical protein